MARMQRVESTAIHAWSHNARLGRLTLRFEQDGSTYRYWLRSAPPDHDGSTCPVCGQGATAIAAAFAAAPSKGSYYNAVLRRGHFVTQRAPNWRRRGRARPMPREVTQVTSDPEPVPVAMSTRSASRVIVPAAERWSARAASPVRTVARPVEPPFRDWCSMLGVAATRGIAALIVLGVAFGSAGPVRGATPTGSPGTTPDAPGAASIDPCPHYGTHGLAPVTSGGTSRGQATSTAAATTRLCVAAIVEVTGPATNGATSPAPAVVSQASSALTVYVGRASDPAIRALLPPRFAAESTWVVVVSDL